MYINNLDNNGSDYPWQNFLEVLKKAPSLEERKILSMEASDWLEGSEDETCRFVVDSNFLNNQRYLNRHLIFVNQKMQMDGVYICAFFSAEERSALLRKRYPKTFRFHYLVDFFWHRACPKMFLTRRLYFSIYKQVKRVYPVPEVLGRLSFCGFDILHSEVIDKATVVVCRKRGLPSTDAHPSYNLLITLRRIGKNGKWFNVYKLRTMYAYSEYLQQYVYEKCALDKEGKFANDFRISGWGRRLRKYWLDELPMLLNILKGDMKIVGVRPLSEQYYSLYTPEMQQLRITAKPGLLPPFYVDMPEGIDEVQESERKYIEAFRAHPFRTQWVYFWKIIYSILIKRHHSH